VFRTNTLSQYWKFAEEHGVWCFYETGGSPDVVYHCDGKRKGADRSPTILSFLPVLKLLASHIKLCNKSPLHFSTQNKIIMKCVICDDIPVDSKYSVLQCHWCLREVWVTSQFSPTVTMAFHRVRHKNLAVRVYINKTWKYQWSAAIQLPVAHDLSVWVTV
jgi:hypothetical protein